MATLDITPSFLNPLLGEDGIEGDVTLTHVAFTATLDNITYQFAIKSNQRDDSWALDTFSFSGESLVLGIRLVAGISLYFPYKKYLDVPQGTLFVSPQSAGGYVDPTLSSFVQGTHTLYYVEVDS